MFVRELISNASDALEKYRHLQITNTPGADPQKLLEIKITTDKAARTLTIEVAENLGKHYTTMRRLRFCCRTPVLG